jgi:hypothetical protein
MFFQSRKKDLFVWKSQKKSNHSIDTEATKSNSKEFWCQSFFLLSPVRKQIRVLFRFFAVFRASLLRSKVVCKTFFRRSQKINSSDVQLCNSDAG